MSLIHLNMATTALPPELGFASVSKTLTFRPAQLMPERSVLRITGFQNCRQFTVESRIVASDEADEAVQRGGAANRFEVETLPSEFEVPMILESRIDSEHAAVGDLVYLRNTGSTVVPRNAKAVARITRLDLAEGKRHLELAVLAFEIGVALEGRHDDRDSAHSGQGSLRHARQYAAVTTQPSDIGSGPVRPSD